MEGRGGQSRVLVDMLDGYARVRTSCRLFKPLNMNMRDRDHLHVG